MVKLTFKQDYIQRKDKPWRHSITRNTIARDENAQYIEHASMLDHFAIKEYLVEHGYIYTVDSTFMTGYLVRGAVAVLPYCGRYGRGFIIAHSARGATVACNYYLKEVTGRREYKTDNKRSNIECFISVK